MLLSETSRRPGKSRPRDKLAILGTDTAKLIATIDHHLAAANDTRRFP